MGPKKNSKLTKPLRILVARTDRLGDVLLSTPVLGAIRQALPETKIGFLTKPEFEPLFRSHPWVDEWFGWEKGKALPREIFKNGPWDQALLLQTSFELSWKLRNAGFRSLFGPRSKFHSYFLFKKSLRQFRSTRAKHETQYGLELLSLLGIQNPISLSPKVSISESAHAFAEKILRESGIKADSPWIVIHPGMGGSARNWQLANYIELARLALRNGIQVIVTGGPFEGDLLVEFQSQVKDVAILGIDSVLPIDVLGAIYERAKVVVAPSTGPLHLAVTMGTSTLSIYSPVHVQHPRRWGPWDPEHPGKHEVLLPSVKCPGTFRCLGAKCRDWDCFKLLTPTLAWEKLRVLTSREAS